MIKIDPIYRTLHLIDFKLKCTSQLVDLKNGGIISLKKITILIYLNPPLTHRGTINKKHKLYCIKIRNLVIEGIKQIKKELRKRNDND